MEKNNRNLWYSFPVISNTQKRFYHSKKERFWKSCFCSDYRILWQNIMASTDLWRLMLLGSLLLQ